MAKKLDLFMNNNIIKIIEILEQDYKDSKCMLIYSTPLELLIAARLSAHCTDARVNIVTPVLFARYKNIDDFANSSQEELEEYIKSCGLYKTKANNIINMCKEIINNFDYKIPDNIEDLQKLSGIGRKTANLFLAEIHNIPGIVVDTHFARVTKRLGFHDSKNPVVIENIMKKIVPEEKSIQFGHCIISHGRKVCKARKPECSTCNLSKFCRYFIENQKLENKR